MVRAYSELSTCRAIGPNGIGPIPVTVMWQWCDRHGLDRELADHVTTVLRHVDAETLRRAAQRAREAAQAKK
jgi:hypothetical protein